MTAATSGYELTIAPSYRYVHRENRPLWCTVYNLERNNDYSAAKAERELGFCCRLLNETIADSIIWLKREGVLSVNE